MYSKFKNSGIGVIKMLSDKIGTLKQDLADLKGEIDETLIKNPSLIDKFEKLEDDLKEYLENAELAITYLK